MDNTRALASESPVEQDFPADAEPRMDAPPVINLDERRMHVRAYNFWVSLLNGRPFPSILDLDPASIADFAANSVLLDFSENPENPRVSFLGAALRQEGGIEGAIESLSQVPPRSLLSRLTDHYLQIIANRAPIGFEAEFLNQRGHESMYRGILMPFSANGETIDYIYGVINWKEVAPQAVTDTLRDAVEAAMVAPAAPQAVAAPWDEAPAPAPDVALEDMLSEAIEPGADASLYDRLAAARILAEESDSADQRSRAALYRTLGLAYDFACATEADPETYAEILEDAGLKQQARAPMTPVVKLIFGIGYDKTRLSEYALVLSHARATGIEPGTLCAHLESLAGGLKAMIRDGRAARRPLPAPDRAARGRAALAAAPALAIVRIDTGLDSDSDFFSLIGRRESDGSLAIVSATPAGDSLLAQAGKTHSG